MFGMTNEQVLAFNRDVIDTFRSNGGAIPDGPLQGNPTLLLTMTGARSGRRLTTPLSYAVDDDHALIVMASAGGSPTLPAWAHNIRAEPAVTVEVHDQVYDAVAQEAGGEDRQRVLARMIDTLPRFAEYESAVERVIPLFRLVRAEERAPRAGDAG
ncbi:MAG: nitroreductase/quinone reductase family protein [Actinomycetota bacterium]